jgi:hypothetical protein
MTVQKAVQRAGLKAMMSKSMVGVPDYSNDREALTRVGTVIGESASHKERQVRASDGLSRSTSKVSVPAHIRSNLNIWIWLAALGTSFCTVGLFGVLVYWQFR